MIEAEDMAPPVMTATATLTITIVDVNDEAPTFSSDRYVLTVRGVCLRIVL